MSWIVALYQIPSHIQQLADIPPDFELQPLGMYDEVMPILREFFPQVDFSTPDWIEIGSDEVGGVYVMEADPIFDVMLRDASPAFIQRICQRTGWRAFDPEDGRLIS